MAACAFVVSLKMFFNLLMVGVLFWYLAIFVLAFIHCLPHFLPSPPTLCVRLSLSVCEFVCVQLHMSFSTLFATRQCMSISFHFISFIVAFFIYPSFFPSLSLSRSVLILCFIFPSVQMHYTFFQWAYTRSRFEHTVQSWYVKQFWMNVLQKKPKPNQRKHNTEKYRKATHQ